MRATATRDKAKLRFAAIDANETEHFSRFSVLIESVFDMRPEPAWPVMAFVDDVGRCVAGLQHECLGLQCDGAPVPVAAIRNVAVAPEWRGHGLMQDLMVPALKWCDAHADLALLYAETPSLYTRQGFAAVPQHAFEAEAPLPTGAATAHPLDGNAASTVKHLLAARHPVSSLCGVMEDGGMAEHKLRSGAWPLSYDAALDALILHETEGETLVLGDIVAATMPSASRILGALGVRPKRLRTLFSPDKLAWDGVPVAEDAGLMARGVLPAAMRRPFILPPTFEF